METQDVLAFWFAEENRPHWFAKNPAFDEKVHMLFYPLWQRAAAGTLHGWRKTMQGAAGRNHHPRPVFPQPVPQQPAGLRAGLGRPVSGAGSHHPPRLRRHDPRRTPIHADALYAQRKRGAARPRRRRIQTIRPRRTAGFRAQTPGRHRPLRPLPPPQRRFGTRKHTRRAEIPRRRRPGVLESADTRTHQTERADFR